MSSQGAAKRKRREEKKKKRNIVIPGRLWPRSGDLSGKVEVRINKMYLLHSMYVNWFFFFFLTVTGLLVADLFLFFSLDRRSLTDFKRGTYIHS